MLLCKTHELGYNFFECHKCDNFHILFNTCKSRFCNSCGIKYAKQRTTAVNKVMLDVKHRHITFTIPDTIRHYFRSDRSLLNVLFEAVNQTLKWVARKHSKKIKYQFGYVLTPHTFGRPLTFNPHIHALVTEAVVDKNNPEHLFNEPEVLMLCEVCGKEYWIEHELLIGVNYWLKGVHNIVCVHCNKESFPMYPKHLVDGDNKSITIEYLLKIFNT